MLEFETLTYENYHKVCGFFAYNVPAGCNLTVGCKLMWSHYYHSAFAVYKNALIWKDVINGDVRFNLPISAEDTEEACLAVEEYCAEKEIPLVWYDVPEEKLVDVVRNYSFCSLRNDRNYDDYLYDAESFRSFSGKKYAGQRNHIHKFFSKYPQAIFREIQEEDRENVDRFFEEVTREATSEKMREEYRLSREFFRRIRLQDWKTGCMTVDGKIVSVTLGETVGKCLVVHIEKALREYEGLYTATANAFAKANGDAEILNREDDSGARGLRISKTQYHPVGMVKKYEIRIANELHKIHKLPVLKTERLTLSGIEEKDASAYYEICADEERNVFWGYDYKEDLHENLYPNYFFDVQAEDFRKKIGASFAVRLNGKMIGEGIFYHFDGRGRAELGMRIAKSYAGKGYGKDAFYALVEWGLYSLGLRKVISKCMHENTASQKMLSEGMKKTGADERFLYFEVTL